MLEDNYMAQIRSLQQRINPKPSAEEIEKRKQVFMLIREINNCVGFVCSFDYKGFKINNVFIKESVSWDPKGKEFLLFTENGIFDVKDIENFVCCF